MEEDTTSGWTTADTFFPNAENAIERRRHGGGVGSARAWRAGVREWPRPAVSVVASGEWTISQHRRLVYLVRRLCLRNTWGILMEELKFKGHIPGLDLLRGVAISLVVLYHGIDGRAPFQGFTGITRDVVYLTTWGSSGVHLFFVLSGFLITGILLDGVSKGTSYLSFYRRRALRILPAYFLILVILRLTNIVSWNFVVAALLFIANMAKLVGAKTSEYGPLWSLAVEEQFYLIWPWVVRRLTLRSLSISIIGVCFVLFTILVLVRSRFPSLDLKYKLWGNAPWLLAGALVSVGLRSGAIRRPNIRSWIAIVAGGAALLSPIVWYIDSGHDSSCLTPLYRLPFVLMFVAFLLLVISQNRDNASSNDRGLVFRAFSFLGYISYGLYLVHQLIFHAFDGVLSNTWLATSRDNIWCVALVYIICFAVSIVLAYLSRRYFEAIFLGDGGRRSVWGLKSPTV